MSRPNDVPTHPVPPIPGHAPVDLARLRKGSKVKHSDGRELHVSGMYLSTDGPVLMAKLSPTQVVAENVPLANVDSVVRF